MTHLRPTITTRLLLTSALLLCASCAVPTPPPAQPRPDTGEPRPVPPAPAPGVDRVFSMVGVALTPRRFPLHTPADVEEMFDIGRELGSTAVFIYQWGQEDHLRIAEQVSTMSRQRSLMPFIGLSPLTLGDRRSKLEAPAATRRSAGGELSFRTAQVREAYVRDAVALARLRPPYLCLGTEVNFLAIGNPQEYQALVAAYKQAYAAVKQVSPETKVFVSFQWDIMREHDLKNPGRSAEQTKLIDDFRPALDAVGLTTYPSPIFDTPEDMPADYYSRVFDHVRRDDELVYMEIGWPTRASGSPQEQVRFIERLPALFAQVRPSVLQWSLLHDIRLPLLGDDLFSTGLIEANGMRKPSFEAFRRLRAR